MKDLSLKIDLNLQHLDIALAKDDSDSINRHMETLESDLLDNESYKKIGNERTLSKAAQLLSQNYGSENKNRLVPLYRWLDVIRDINDKFFFIIDHKIALDELLFSKLTFWKYLSKDINCRFDEESKQRLKDARDQSNSVEKIQTFISVYFDYVIRQVPELDFSDLVSVTELVLDNLKRLKQWNVQALFSLSKDRGDVYGIKILPNSEGTGSITALNKIDTEMETAVKKCFEFIKNKYPSTKAWDIQWDIEREDIPFAGQSIGLALTVGILSSIQGFEIDPFTAFTGKVEWTTGEVKAIGDLEIKLKAAAAKGIRRVFIPAENKEDHSEIPDLDIIQVGSVEEAKTHLIEKSYVSASSSLEQQAEIKLKQVELELVSKGIKALRGIQSGRNYKRLVFTDFSDEISVDAYFGRDGIKLIIQQKNCSLKNIIRVVCEQISGNNRHETTDLVKRDKYIVSDKDVQKRIESYIFSLPYAIREVEQNCLYRARISKNGLSIHVRQFSKGTLTIDGQDSLFSEINVGIRAVLGLSASSVSGNPNDNKLEKQIEAVKAVNLGTEWIGTDEAGKGDYFGPLVGAAVFIDNNLADRLAKLGVKDSKQLSDNRNKELASKIINICGKRAQVVLIPPARYNQLYQEFKQEGKNLNTLLAWVHTRALDDILSNFPQDQITVIIDKFADEQYIKNRLLENARRTNLNLVQLPKAEANIAVAAASILARAQFLNWLERASQQLNISLPKGSSDPKIPQVARQIIEKYGKEKLAEVAKMHFKTTKDIL